MKFDHTLDLDRSNKRLILQDIVDLVRKAEDTCKERRWKCKGLRGEKIVIRDVFAKMTSWIDKFKGVVDVIVQYDPGHAALPWAAVRFILTVRVPIDLFWHLN